MRRPRLSRSGPSPAHKTISWEIGLPVERSRAALYRQIRAEGSRLVTEARCRPVLVVEVFGLPFGKLEAGAPADVVVLDYRPPTPLNEANLGGHLLFGLDRSHVRSVLVAGRWIVREGRVVTVDAPAVLARSRAAAAKLWERMSRL